MFNYNKKSIPTHALERKQILNIKTTGFTVTNLSVVNNVRLLALSTLIIVFMILVSPAPALAFFGGTTEACGADSNLVNGLVQIFMSTEYCDTLAKLFDQNCTFSIPKICYFHDLLFLKNVLIDLLLADGNEQVIRHILENLNNGQLKDLEKLVACNLFFVPFYNVHFPFPYGLVTMVYPFHCLLTGNLLFASAFLDYPTLGFDICSVCTLVSVAMVCGIPHLQEIPLFWHDPLQGVRQAKLDLINQIVELVMVNSNYQYLYKTFMCHATTFSIPPEFDLCVNTMGYQLLPYILSCPHDDICVKATLYHFNNDHLVQLLNLLTTIL